MRREIQIVCMHMINLHYAPVRGVAQHFQCLFGLREGPADGASRNSAITSIPNVRTVMFLFLPCQTMARIP